MQKEHALKIASKLLIEPVYKQMAEIEASKSCYGSVSYEGAIQELGIANLLWDEICQNNMFDVTLDEVSEAYQAKLEGSDADEKFENEKTALLLSVIEKYDEIKTLHTKDDFQGAFVGICESMLEKFTRFLYSDMDCNRQAWNTKKTPKEILILERAGLLTRAGDKIHWKISKSMQGVWKENATKVLAKAGYEKPKWSTLVPFLLTDDNKHYAERSIYKVINS